MTQIDEARAREIYQRIILLRPDMAMAAFATALKQARREGAEQMREAAGKRIDDIATAWAQMPISQAYREIAISVRALPLPGDPT